MRGWCFWKCWKNSFSTFFTLCLKFGLKWFWGHVRHFFFVFRFLFQIKCGWKMLALVFGRWYVWTCCWVMLWFFKENAMLHCWDACRSLSCKAKMLLSAQWASPCVAACNRLRDSTLPLPNGIKFNQPDQHPGATVVTIYDADENHVVSSPPWCHETVAIVSVLPNGVPWPDATGNAVDCAAALARCKWTCPRA